MPIALEIYAPEKLVFSDKADKVVLPVAEGTLTIIQGRAPRLQALTAGDVVLLDEANREVKRVGISGGVADIASEKVHLLLVSGTRLMGA